jgi:addiction module HigA family antidote
MYDPPHPGEHLREDWIESLGISVTKAASILGVARKTLDAVVNCRAGISPEMAIRISKAFGGEPDIWLRMQMQYDLWQAQQKADTIKVKRYEHV